ncbi:MAG: hypothetical protein KDE19_00035, partial [Caldilineaceae bacterium]|nr:hypothetical protein [Caldilineaceae bacterium]
MVHHPGFCHHLDQTLKLPYVGTLTTDEVVRLKTGEQKVSDFAQALKAEHQQRLATRECGVFPPIRIHYKGETEHYYSYCATHRLNNFGRVRLVINHRQADLADKPVFYITNQTSMLRNSLVALASTRHHSDSSPSLARGSLSRRG